MENPSFELREVGRWVRAVAPASLSNLGPGFDALGLCIDTHHDVVEVCLDDGVEGVVIDSITGLYDRIPKQIEKNTASIALSSLLDAASKETGVRSGLRMRIQKGIPLGSGIGGSAASAVAGAVAAGALFGVGRNSAVVIEAALTGESAASGARHGDNVLPSMFGGLIATTPRNPSRFQRIGVTERMSLALVLPSIPILTQQARTGLPSEVPFESAIKNAAGAAGIVAACINGDWEALGACIMVDEIVEPVRAELLPGYRQTCEAALRTGAYGVALSGSGPAMFAVCAHDAHARRVASAMSDALAKAGVDAESFVAHPANHGCQVDQP